MAASRRLTGALVLQYHDALRPLLKARKRFAQFVRDVEGLPGLDEVTKRDLDLARRAVEVLGQLENELGF